MIRARRRFGQHFLEPAWVDRLVRAIDPQPDETFVEIGPGGGELTRPLAARAKRVIAYEIDRDLAAALRDTAPANVTVVEGDFLEHDLIASHAGRSSDGGQLRVAANLPYNVASPILFKLADAYLAGVPLGDATVMLQREVADRLLAAPGTKEYGVLTILMGHVAAAERVFNLPPGAFRPAPKVHSAVVRLRLHPPDPPVKDRELFTRLVQAVFTRRRKTLANALRAFEPGVGVGGQSRGSEFGVRVRGQSSGSESGVRVEGRSRGSESGLDLTRRPETLSIAEFAHLADVFSSP